MTSFSISSGCERVDGGVDLHLRVRDVRHGINRQMNGRPGAHANQDERSKQPQAARCRMAKVMRWVSMNQGVVFAVSAAASRRMEMPPQQDRQL